METYFSNRDIVLKCVTALSFPNGIAAAHETLHSLLSSTQGRNFYGVSRMNEKGDIVYKAAVEQKDNEEEAINGLETVVLKKGEYISALILNFWSDKQSIGRTFQEMIQHPRIDPNGYCVEQYVSMNDVRCMVRLGGE